MTITGNYASYLVRIWRGPLTDLAPWRSQVTHIQSGKCWGFNSLKDLQAFLGRPEEEWLASRSSGEIASEAPGDYGVFGGLGQTEL